MFREREGTLEVFLVHPGGPFYRRKDAGVWSIPKGELESGEESLTAARRELVEETGVVPHGPFLPLGRVRLKSGKIVEAWAFRGDADPDQVGGSTFSLEWPPKSGRFVEFPEVDRAAFFGTDEARHRIHPGQVPFIERLETELRTNQGAAEWIGATASE